MSIRREFLDLLKTDEEFRYTVAGLIGLEDLRAGQARLQESIARLQEGVARLEESVARLQDAVAKLAEALANVRSEVGGLSFTVGAMAESSARRALRDWMRSRGLTAEKLTYLRLVIDGEEVEINFYGKARDDRGVIVPVYAEAKASIRSREVKEFAKAVAKVEKLYGRGVRALVAFRIFEDAYQAAADEGIEVVEV
ncbi:MAG: hypothetical protein QW724_04950 [Nitrososphaerota archaeon]